VHTRGHVINRRDLEVSVCVKVVLRWVMDVMAISTGMDSSEEVLCVYVKGTNV
jgi:hypothetical protein